MHSKPKVTARKLVLGTGVLPRISRALQAHFTCLARSLVLPANLFWFVSLVVSCVIQIEACLRTITIFFFNNVGKGLQCPIK